MMKVSARFARNKKRTDLSNYLQKSQSTENITEPMFLKIVKGACKCPTSVIYYIITQMRLRIIFFYLFSLTYIQVHVEIYKYGSRVLTAMQGNNKSESKERHRSSKSSLVFSIEEESK